MSITDSLLEHEAVVDDVVLRTSEVSPLNIVIFTSGSRGDVQPYIALGLCLQAEGHTVSIATEKRMKPLVEEFGLEHRCLGGDPTGYLFEPGATEKLANASMFQLVRLVEEWDKRFPKDAVLASYVSCAEGAHLIVSAGLTLTASFCVAEKMQVPWLPVVLGATMPTSEFPLWALESLAVCSCLNKWTYNLVFKTLWNSESKFINPWRTNVLGLPPMTSARGIADVIDELAPPVIVACSKRIVGPKGEVPEDYPVNVHIPGFFFVPPSSESAIDPRLVQFLDNNPQNFRTVFLGFGSMPVGNPLSLVSLALEICASMVCRAVLVAGWSEIDSEECQAMVMPAVEAGQLIIVKAVPHDWLFPRMDCIIHHCGVGTMAAALRAGKPQLPCPVMLDQPFNARIVRRLGCCLDIIPAVQIDASKISRALERIFCNDRDVFGVAERLGAEIEEESQSSLEQACEIITDYARKFALRR